MVELKEIIFFQHIPATVSQIASTLTPKTPASAKKAAAAAATEEVSLKRKRAEVDTPDLPANKKQAKVIFCCDLTNWDAAMLIFKYFMTSFILCLFDILVYRSYLKFISKKTYIKFLMTLKLL